MAWTSIPPCSSRPGCFHFTSRKARAAAFTESSGVVPDFPWGGALRSQGSQASAGADWRHPAAGWQSSRKAWASCPTFLGAEPCEAKVRRPPLVLIGGLLPPAGSGLCSVVSSRGADSCPDDASTCDEARGSANARGAFENGPLSATLHQSPCRPFSAATRLLPPPSRLLPSRKARASCPTFLEAEPCEAKVRRLPLVLIGGILPPAGSGLWSVVSSCGAKSGPDDASTCDEARGSANARGAFENGPLSATLHQSPCGPFSAATRLLPPPSRWLLLASRKARASCPTFLEAEPCEAKVRRPPLVLIGGILPPSGAGRWR